MAGIRCADKNDRLPYIVLFGQSSTTKRKIAFTRMGGDEVVRYDLMEIENSWEGLKREALIRLGWRKSSRSCFGIRRLGDQWAFTSSRLLEVPKLNKTK